MRLSSNKVRGFTLVEVVITVAIVAILAAIATPSYRSYVERTNRTVAKAALGEVISRQDSYYVDRKGYAKTLGKLGFKANTLYLNREGNLLDASSTDSIYRFTLQGSPSSTTCPPGGSGTLAGFTAVAEPIGSQANDTRCAKLCMSSTGIKGASGTDKAECWKR